MDRISSEPDRIDRWLLEHREEITAAADFLFHHPETFYKEIESSRCLAAFLSTNRPA